MYFDKTSRFSEKETYSVDPTTVLQESTEQQKNSRDDFKSYIDHFVGLNQDILMYTPPYVANLPSPTPSRHKRSFSFTSASSGKK